MLQIRLSKGAASSGDGVTSGVYAVKQQPESAVEGVTVACPDHLVIADLAVAKSLGSVTAAANSIGRTIGRRSRRPIGERVHICFRCDFPIAIYGRLVPCEHVFCLACARSDSSCHLCDERIQKIQSIKMMEGEGVFICAAPHCMKSFLKKSDFSSHVTECHADLLQMHTGKEESHESDYREVSTARAPQRYGVPSASSSQIQERDEQRSRHYQGQDQQQPGKLRPFAFQSHMQYQLGDIQTANLESLSGDQIPQNKQIGMAFAMPPFYSPVQPQPHYAMPVTMNRPLVPNPSFGSTPLPQDGNQQFLTAPFQFRLPTDVGPDQISSVGISPNPAGVVSFQSGFPHPWGTGMVAVPIVGQGSSEGFPSSAEVPSTISFPQQGLYTMPDSSAANLNAPGKDGQVVQADQENRLPHVSLLLPPPPVQPLPGYMAAQESYNRPGLTGSNGNN